MATARTAQESHIEGKNQNRELRRCDLIQ